MLEEWRYQYHASTKQVRRTFGEINPEAIPFTFIGTQVYMQQQVPWIDGTSRAVLKKWDINSIKRQHSSKYLAKIPAYLGFTVIPDNTGGYRRVIDGFYNKYEPLQHTPEPGDCRHTLKFLKHIFGKQLRLGLDYLQLLYLKPTQRLPILALLSRERKTGKSTFIYWLKEIYKLQMQVYKTSQMKSNFNSDWTGKLLIGIDESAFSMDEDMVESFKFWNFAPIILSEAKGVDRIEVPFFAKFVMASNREHDFLPIDAAEDRFWVRHVPSIKKEDPNFMEKLIEEIPSFLYYLKERELTTKQQTRMWFAAKQIETDALKMVKQKSKSVVEQELRESIRDYFFEVYEEVHRTRNEDVLRLTRSDLSDRLQKIGTKASGIEVTRIFQEWGIKPARNGWYQIFGLSQQGALIHVRKRGLYYEFRPQDYLSEEERANMARPVSTTPLATDKEASTPESPTLFEQSDTKPDTPPF
ncbi:MAG: primase-helicase family protein [Bacteroidota bacterium]